MSLLSKNLDYTDRDFDSLSRRLQQLITSVFPTWSDFNKAQFGTILVELFAFVGDTLTFYQDTQANESRIVTATQRKNILALCKLIGFKPAGASAATVDQTFTLKAPPIGTFTLPAGTIASTADVTSPVRFQLLADLVFAPGLNPPTHVGTIENSETQSDVFTSSGLPNQTFALASTPYLDDSAIPVASDGTYTQVDNFLDSTGTDKHFTATVDQNDRALVAFGNGVNGKIPVGTITVGYKTGGGAAGIVEASSITQVPGSFVDSLGNPVTVTTTNALASSGGTERQSVQQIQALAPATLRSLTRTVSREDFEIHALTIPGVARALMTTSNEDPGVEENAGILYVVPAGGGAPSNALKTQVKNLFVTPDPSSPAPYPCTLTFSLAIQNPSYLTLNPSMTVWFKSGVTPAAGAKAIRDALAAYFAISLPDGTPNPTVDFGFYYRDAAGTPLDSIGLEDVLDVVHDVPQVLRVGGLASDFQINGAHTDIPVARRQFPTLGTVSITNGIDGSSL